MSDNPPPTTPSPRPSSPALSSSSWASFMLPSTPRDTSPTPSSHTASASLREHETALQKALKGLADEKVKLAQEKDLRERERKANDVERRNNDTYRENNERVRTDLERDRANLAARQRAAGPVYTSPVHGHSRKHEDWKILAWILGGLACVIPGFFALGTVATVQVELSARVMNWVFGIFGI